MTPILALVSSCHMAMAQSHRSNHTNFTSISMGGTVQDGDIFSASAVEISVLRKAIDISYLNYHTMCRLNFYLTVVKSTWPRDELISEKLGHKWIVYCLVWSSWSHVLNRSRTHDDVIKWKHFPRHWPFVRWIHWWPVYSLPKGQWREALVFSLICAWTNR